MVTIMARRRYKNRQAVCGGIYCRTQLPLLVLVFVLKVFEIRTKDGPVSVSSFDINLDLENDDERIEIW